MLRRGCWTVIISTPVVMMLLCVLVVVVLGEGVEEEKEKWGEAEDGRVSCMMDTSKIWI